MLENLGDEVFLHEVLNQIKLVLEKKKTYSLVCFGHAEMTGKVVIDYGHTLDWFINGKNYDDEKLLANFNEKINGRRRKLK